MYRATKTQMTVDLSSETVRSKGQWRVILKSEEKNTYESKIPHTEKMSFKTED